MLAHSTVFANLSSSFEGVDRNIRLLSRPGHSRKPPPTAIGSAVISLEFHSNPEPLFDFKPVFVGQRREFLVRLHLIPIGHRRNVIL